MADNVSVDLEVVERAFAILLAALRANQGPVSELGNDYFWSVPVDWASEVYAEPGELTIGQISECHGWLEALLEDPDRAIPQHLIWLGDVLRALGGNARADFTAPLDEAN